MPQPRVCEECLRERRAAQKVALLCYDEEEADLEVVLRLEEPQQGDPVFFSAKAVLVSVLG